MSEKLEEKGISENSNSQTEDKERVSDPKYREWSIRASLLSLGISIVVAVLIGVGIGIFLERTFDKHWLLFLGIFWGIGAAILNVYKAYNSQVKEYEEVAKDIKYTYDKEALKENRLEEESIKTSYEK